MAQDKLETRIKAKAAELGFAAIGITHADAAPKTVERLHQWLAKGRHGSMIWMADRAHQRQSPTSLWPEVRSIISSASAMPRPKTRCGWRIMGGSGAFRSMRRGRTIMMS
ncbi:hypothetical protein GCM10020258_25610 [Sphingomonas yabuuchiae]